LLLLVLVLVLEKTVTEASPEDRAQSCRRPARARTRA
jgi:hypothetical protein